MNDAWYSAPPHHCGTQKTRSAPPSRARRHRLGHVLVPKPEDAWLANARLQRSGDLVEGDEAEGQPVDVDVGRLERSVEVGAGAGRRDAGIVELLQRLEESGRPAIEEVIGGEGGDVDAIRVAEPRQDGGIDAEDDAVVDGEVGDDRALEVVDRDVRAAHAGLRRPPRCPIRTASTMLKPLPTKPGGTGFG